MSHPTIRTIAGASATSALQAATTALLVIDFQNEYFTGKMPIPDGLKALANANRLIRFADQHRMPVFHVQHVRPAGSPIFALDSKNVEFHAEIQPEAHHRVVQKEQVSVFVNTDIDAQLKAAGIKTLIISGLMTHACVAGASRDAAPAGYAVIVASDAAATREIDAPGGGAIAHDALHRSALVTIADAFGEVLDTRAILALPVR